MASGPAEHSQFALFKTRRFLPLFVTQFLGAFNDNLFKNALIVLLTFQTASWTTLEPAILTNLAGGIFILPFFLFSATAGQLADKYDKAVLARCVKVLEMVIMIVAGLGFFLHHLAILFCALCLLGLHSTLFGPVKYSILPQHLREDELVGGNAFIESGSFIAILVGTLAGGLLAGSAGHPAWVAAAGLGVAVVGFLTSWAIPAAPAPSPQITINLNIFSETWRNIGFARENRTVFLSILGASWFWLYGALFLAQVPVYAKNVLGGSESSVTLLLAIFTVGIGLGSVLCEKLSGKFVEIGLVPFGSLGLTIFAVDLYFASPSALPALAPISLPSLLAIPGTWRVLLDLLLLGVFGGFFTVPLYVLIQLRSAPENRARIIAANNIMNALFMVVGALSAAALLGNGITIPQLFCLAAIINAGVAIYIYSLVPEFLLRFVAWLLVHTVYRLETKGIAHVPHDGPAVLVCNHVSVVDAIVISAAVRRPIRFVVDQRLFARPVIGFLLRHMKAVPIDCEADSVNTVMHEDVAMVLAQGDLVCLFPEAEMTRDGTVGPFRVDSQRIVERAPAVPVVPMALRGLWGGFFSRKDGPAMGLAAHLRPFTRVELVVGERLNAEAATLDRLQGDVVALCGDAKAVE